MDKSSSSLGPSSSATERNLPQKKSREEDDNDNEFNLKVSKYSRGSLDNVNSKSIRFKGLKKTIEESQAAVKDAATKTAAAEVLLPANPGCIELSGDGNITKIYKLRQKEIIPNVDLNTAKKCIDLQLTKFGPYTVDYSRNGRFCLFSGRKGHVAAIDCLKTAVSMELQLQEEVHDVQYLQNETLFAVAQAKYTYIYDHKGVEIHCMKRHERPVKLDYLPYHFLLTSASSNSWIKWHDISIGEYVAGYATGHGPIRALKHNSVNAVSHVGHVNGVVSLWSPTSGKALVSMFCHTAPVTDLAIDREGRYMVTAGLDGFMKVWDLRKYTSIYGFRLDKPAMSVDISDRGLVALAVGRTVQILGHALPTTMPTSQSHPSDTTYLSHAIRTPNPNLSSGAGAVAAANALLSNVSVSCVRFCPYEDILCAGHSHGLTSIVVPGAGEPNYDSFENDPFMNSRQRRENEVQTLLSKLSHEMIGLDASFVGTVEKDAATLAEEHKELFEAANKRDLDKKEKNKGRGKNKISAKLRRKQKNVLDVQMLKFRDKQEKDREKDKQDHTSAESEAAKKDALSRFSKK